VIRHEHQLGGRHDRYEDHADRVADDQVEAHLQAAQRTLPGKHVGGGQADGREPGHQRRGNERRVSAVHRADDRRDERAGDGRDQCRPFHGSRPADRKR
jgi:hypothetical protein